MIAFSNQITIENDGGNNVNQYPNMPNAQPTPFMNQTPYNMSELNDLMNYRIAYPEIYYKCQPFVMMACDQLDALTTEMPTQEMIEIMSDNLYDDISRMYPDLVEYATNADQKYEEDIPTQGFQNYDRDRDGRRFRRRGVFRDFIDFLLLSELFRRRRRNY